MGISADALDNQALKALVTKDGEALVLPPSRGLSSGGSRNEQATAVCSTGYAAVEPRLSGEARQVGGRSAGRATSAGSETATLWIPAFDRALAPVRRAPKPQAGVLPLPS